MKNFLGETAKLKKLTIFLLFLFPALAVWISLGFQTSFLVSTLLFFGLPSLWLSLVSPRDIKKSLLYTFVLFIPVTIVVDSLAVINKVWAIKTIFSFRLFGTVSLEQFLWVFLFFYSIVMFYEYFFDRFTREVVSPKLKYFGLTLLLCLGLVVVGLSRSPQALLLQVSYLYLVLGAILLVLPLLLLLSLFPGLLDKFVKTGAYFFYLAALNELVGLKLGHWYFPGQNFIGWIYTFGVNFPVEELLWYFLLGAVGMLAYYELFDDDLK